MADESLNPKDNAELAGLRKDLNQLGDRLQTRLNQAERAARETTQQEVRGLGKTVREEARAGASGGVRVRGGGEAPIVTGVTPVSEQADAEQRAAQATERRARAMSELQRFNVDATESLGQHASYTERQFALERNLGLQRAQNLQLLQRQSETLRGVGGISGVGLQRQSMAFPGGYRTREVAGPPIGPLTQAEADPFYRVRQALDSLRTQGFGGGGGGGGGRPPAPPGPPDEPPPPDRNLRDSLGNNRHVQNAQAADKDMQAERALARAYEGSDVSIAQMNARLAESTRTLAINGNQLRAHGALTTEFIQAAARGQTTFRELGFQVGATIGKFAGWTGAAAAVYGALGAVQQFRQGALDSLQGVNLLQRVVNNLNTDQAQRSFRDLALQFNLPIGEVVQTSYEASKAFKDQNDAMLATKAALYGVKVGEIDAADAGRLVTAVARGFHLQATDLIPVMNTVNALQNAFGASFEGTAKGVAAAAGAFHAAGGSYQELAAAVSTISQVTGIQGQMAATGLRRTAELAFRPERRQGILEVLGIDTKNASTTIAEILNRAQALVAKGRNPLEIAKLITTPELASRSIAPLLAAGQLYQARLAVAENPGQSAERERQRAVQSMHDQLSRTGVEFQALGSNLAQAGALNALGGFLKILNTSLGLANHLLDAFNELPKPVREAALYFGEISAAIALMRRFDVGATLGQRFPTLGGIVRRSPEAAAKAQVFQGLGDERTFLQGELQSTGRQRALAEYEAIRAAQRHDVVRQTGTPEEVLASKARLDAREAETVRLAERQADVQDRINENMRQEAAIRERTSYRQRQSIADASAAEGVTYTNPTLNRNVPISAVPIVTEGASPESPAPGLMYRAPIGPLREEEAKAEQLRTTRNSLRGAIESQRVVWMRGAEEETLLSRSMGTLDGSVRFAGRAMQNTAGAVAGFGKSLASFLDDPFIAMTAAFLILESSYQYIKGKTQQSQRQVDSLRAIGGQSTDQIRAHANRELGQSSVMDRLQGGFADAFNAVRSLPVLPGGFRPGQILPHAQSPNQREDAAARDAKRYADQIDAANQHGVALTRAQITQRLNDSLKAADGNKTATDQAFADAAREAGSARGLLFGSGEGGTPTAAELARANKLVDDYKKGIKARKAALDAVTGNMDAALASITDSTGLTGIVTGISNRIAFGGLSRGTAADAGKARSRAVELISQLDKTDPNYDKELGALLQQMDKATSDVVNRATTELQNALITAEPGRIRSVLGTAEQKVRAATIGGQQSDIARVQNRMALRRDQIRAAERADAVAAGQNLVRTDSGFAGIDAVRGLANEANKQDALNALKEAQKGDKKKLDALRASMHMTREAFDAFVRAQEDSAFSLQTAYLESQTADPVQQALIAQQRAQDQLSRSRAGKSAIPVTQALTQLNTQRIQTASAQAQQFQQGLQLAQAREEAGGADQGTVLRDNITRAQRYANYLKGQGKLVDPGQVTSALIAVYQARKALADYLQQSADSLLQAQQALALSKTEDPIKQASIKVEYARKALAAATTAEDKIQKQADLNNAIRDKRNTIQQERFDQIEFEASMGEIGKQTEISMLQGLLQTMHGNRQLRRQIQQRVHDLQTASNDLTSNDLTLGNIRLPTPYEVNRAIKEGGRTAVGGHTFNTRAEVNVYVARAEDAPAVADSIDSVLNTHVRSVLRTRTP